MLRYRWYLVALASLAVITFELLEYHPFRNGLSPNFLFEALFYGTLMPALSGIALSLLAASRAELAWTSYVEELRRNLDVHLSRAHSRCELADTLLQFIRTVTPSVGVEVFLVDRPGMNPTEILSWEQEGVIRDGGASDRCRSANCPLLTSNDGEDEHDWALCLEPSAATLQDVLPTFCMALLHSGSQVAGTRLYFLPGSTPTRMQIRLLRTVAPEFAAAFERARLEEMMKGRDERVEAEHQRIARDVHDSLGQSLGYLRLKVEQISALLESREVENRREIDALRKEVASLGAVANDAYGQMRDVLAVLTPESSLNLDTILHHHAESIRQRAAFELQLKSSGQPRTLPARVQRHVYYIFREALANVEWHARARQVDVRLEWQPSAFVVTVADDGTGFDVDQRVPAGHFGLANMDERAQVIGATLDIASRPGNGTKLTLRVPYLNANESTDR